ncbi:MAG: bifunctional tetrahydrofolate synthase/dihydrofolate synthase [Gammaproteobacteria bacterium]|nr:bifunctional tetrahydrofolate synthase/dihydrofolate synthase [Gammaproteobacteria bacterium]
MQRSLTDWLLWQSTLNPEEIDLGLDRVRVVADNLQLLRPDRAVFTVGGTNGKGSTVAFLEALCLANGLTTAVYTSPHLDRYNERMRINGIDVTDEWLVKSFESVDAARDSLQLTYFEFGTLAALSGFSSEQVDVWILEVGLGGRLDAVNVVDADIALVTTVALEHQEWLGDTINEIALEKAGIYRAGRPAFYGDIQAPVTLVGQATEIGAELALYGKDFGFNRGDDAWSWQGCTLTLENLPLPVVHDDAQMRNFSIALAAIEACDPAWLALPAIRQALEATRPAGRFQIVNHDSNGCQWVFDVAHNPQAAGVLRQRIDALNDPRPLIVVLGMLADKQVKGFVEQFADLAERWLVCSPETGRARDAEDLAAAVAAAGGANVRVEAKLDEALQRAGHNCGDRKRILVTGSFYVVGPALSWHNLQYRQGNSQ